MTDTDESILMRRSRDGDMDAFAELVRRYQAHIRACLAVRLDNRYEAEDIAQETFITAFQKMGDFDTTRPLGPWLRAIAFNHLRNHWRKHRPEPIGHGEELDLLVDEHLSLRYSASGEDGLFSSLKRCLEKLDDSLRQLVRLRYHHDLPVAELAGKLGIKHSTLTMRLYRVRRVLRECVERET